MGFRDLTLKKAFSSDSDDILNDFYVPALEMTVDYQRIAGFFSSSSLSVAAKGINGLLRNQGLMKLIVSPRFNRKDLQVLIDSHSQPEKFIEDRLMAELGSFEDRITEDHVRALGWMVANNKLEIRVATMYDDQGNLITVEDPQSGLFHQKVGILTDSNGDQISFSGSINETAFGWLGNIEEFKVFRSWEPPEKEYIEADISKFQRFWNNQSARVKVSSIPEAVQKKLIELAPDDIGALDITKWYGKRPTHKTIELFQHQKNAVTEWFKHDHRGIFEMATGTGKTFTALDCLNRIKDKFDKLIVVITCPYQHLSRQWERDIITFGIDLPRIMADSSQTNWKNKLAEAMIDVSIGRQKHLIVLTTHRTFSSSDFQYIIRQNRSGSATLLIADEVHGTGANKTSEGLNELYDMRLGLSATPKRWFDDSGTQVIYEYFGEVIFEFGLKEAVSTINSVTGRTFLTPYRYVPIFISLTEREANTYVETTNAITKLFFKAKHDEKMDILDNLRFKRANITKNAVRKYDEFGTLIDQLRENLNGTIVYCTPQQIDQIMNILDQHGIMQKHRFTMEEGTKPDKKYGWISERDFLLQEFANGEYKVLVAMKCLDEGVDVPPAKTAILMASSGNPREFIQRIGRVIRRYPGKDEAQIYDFIVRPDSSTLPEGLRAIERNIFEKELRRCKEIAMIALNNTEAMQILMNVAY